MHVVDIACASNPGKLPQQRRCKHAEEVRRLSAQIGALEAERDVHAAGIALINDIARSRAVDGGEHSTHLDFVDAIVQRRLITTRILAEIDEKVQQLREHIDLLMLTTGVFTATFFAPRDCQAEFQLTYRTVFLPAHFPQR